MGSWLAVVQHRDGLVSPHWASCHQALLQKYLQELHVEEEPKGAAVLDHAGCRGGLPPTCLLSWQCLPLRCLLQGLAEVVKGAWLEQTLVLVEEGSQSSPQVLSLSKTPCAVLCSHRRVGSGQTLSLPKSMP